MMAGMSIYCIGETVLDIIFRDEKPVAAEPGGSMLNSAVSLGRAGLPVHLISDFAQDQPGNIIHNFLLQNQVSTKYIDRFDSGKTALALAFLNENQDADYSFYKFFPKKRLSISFPVINKGDIILFGSFYALTGSIQKKLTGFIRMARAQGAFILYDPNFRESHLPELEKVRPWIIENISLASMVRGSDEDFKLIFGADNAAQAFRYVKEAGCPVLIYTKNKGNVELLTEDTHRSYTVKQIVVTSTIGAGDAFNAGIIYSVATLHPTPTLTGSWTLSGWMLDSLINTGIRFSADVCQSLENYISPDFAKQLKNG
jgi:fructokinase